MNKKLYTKVLLGACISAALSASTPAFSQTIPNIKNLVLNQLDLNNLPVGKFGRDFDDLTEEGKKKTKDWLDMINAKEHDLPFLRVTKDGSVYFADSFPVPASNSATATANTTSTAQVIPPEDAFKLHSKQGSSKVIYLDFDGHLISGTAWNNNSDLNAVPYDMDGNAAVFSDTERASIAEIWRRIAEDYAPFDIDVTTELPSSFGSTVGRILITKDIDANGYDMPAKGSGGVAFVGVFGNSAYATTYSPALVYYNNLSGGRADYVAEAASHEMGHNMGLSHDTTSTSEYYTGQGSGEISWGPIMGASYGRNVTQWSKGEYPDATQQEDDVAIIASKTNYMVDDHANTDSQATPLSIDTDGNVVATTLLTDPNDTLPANKGVINSPFDTDVFSFTSTGGNVVLQASPLQELNNTNGGNVDLALSLYDASGNLVTDSTPANNTDAGINITVAAGTYYLHVQGDSSVNYTNYGSVGQYFIDGVVPVLNDTTAPTPSPMGWSVAPQAQDRFSISMTAVTATDDNSDVEYYFSCSSDTVVCTNSAWQTSPNYVASDLKEGTAYSFQVKARDAAGNETVFSSVATASTQSNAAPTTNDDTGEVKNTASITLSVMDNDSDAENDAMTVTAVTQPTNGSVIFDANGVTYTPNSNYEGNDTFTYTITDALGATATANVTIKVINIPNTAPVASDDIVEVYNTSVAKIAVLNNDTDADGDILSITDVATPSHGTASYENGIVSYTPDAGYVGDDSFSYSISDGNGGSDEAMIMVSVTAKPNTAPVASDDVGEIDNTSTLTLNVLQNDSDADGDSLSIIELSTPANGTADIIDGAIKYTPNANYVGEDTFTYSISDGNGGSDTAKITIKVTEITIENNAPKARFDRARVKQNESVTIDVLSNDKDVDGDQLEIISVTQGRKGSVSIEGNQIVYTAGNRRGWDIFSYTISDGKGGTATARVRMSIKRGSSKPRNDDNEKKPFNPWSRFSGFFGR